MENRVSAAVLSALATALVVHLVSWGWWWHGAPVAPDFHSSYVAARLWSQQAHLAYDIPTEFAAQRELGRLFHSQVAVSPFVQLPASLLLLQPIARLPFPGAYVVISVINLVMVVVAVALVIEGRGLRARQRATLWLVALSSFPVALSLFQAETVPLLLLATAVALRHAVRRPGVAGLALAVASFRYHVLVGAGGALLATRPRLARGLVPGVAILGLLSIAAVSGDIGGQVAALRTAYRAYHAPLFTVPALTLGLPGPLQGPAWGLAAALALALALRAVTRYRHLPGSAALAGGTAWFMVTPYIGAHDFALLSLLATAALAEAWATGPGRGLGYLVAALCCVLEAVVLLGAAGIVPLEAAILVFLAFGPLPAGTPEGLDRGVDLDPVGPVRPALDQRLRGATNQVGV